MSTKLLCRQKKLHTKIATSKLTYRPRSGSRKKPTRGKSYFRLNFEKNASCCWNENLICFVRLNLLLRVAVCEYLWTFLFCVWLLYCFLLVIARVNAIWNKLLHYRRFILSYQWHRKLTNRSTIPSLYFMSPKSYILNTRVCGPSNLIIWI